MHYNRANSYLFVNGVDIHKFKAKDSEINAILLCLGNISKVDNMKKIIWVDNMKKNGLKGYVYDFSVDYDAIEIADILDIQWKVLNEKEWYKIMFRFIKKMFITAMTFVGCGALQYDSMSNQECKVRPAIMNINSNEPLFYPYSIAVNKCSGSCDDINNPYTKLCILDVAKDMNIEVFNLMPRINETSHVSQHETCTSKCRLDASVCKNKQCWNNDQCRCECKELID